LTSGEEGTSFPPRLFCYVFDCLPSLTPVPSQGSQWPLARTVPLIYHIDFEDEEEDDSPVEDVPLSIQDRVPKV
jgi:hypothetical protein